MIGQCDGIVRKGTERARRVGRREASARAVHRHQANSEVAGDLVAWVPGPARIGGAVHIQDRDAARFAYVVEPEGASVGHGDCFGQPHRA